jgi:hypothetical protein
VPSHEVVCGCKGWCLVEILAHDDKARWVLQEQDRFSEIGVSIAFIECCPQCPDVVGDDLGGDDVLLG